MEQRPSTENCTTTFNAVDDALYVIGGKWRLKIITALFDKHQRFNELQRIVQGISSKVLSHELKELEMNGLVKRNMGDVVEYEATPYGFTLHEVVLSLAKWGKMHKTNIMQSENLT
jgi:DNA-binding HxlR family transcriptional regulator